jgi:predicted CoA-binding protein
MSSSPQPDPIADLLKRSKTIAVVGLSNSPLRPSHGVSAYMQMNGYRIIPVNPKIKEALGENAYATLLDVPEKIDIVNIFRRPEFVEEVVDQAIRLKVPAIWMQEEVINQKAADKARQAGIFVIMDSCILKEHKARFGSPVCSSFLMCTFMSFVVKAFELHQSQRMPKLQRKNVASSYAFTRMTVASSCKPAP